MCRSVRVVYVYAGHSYAQREPWSDLEILLPLELGVAEYR